MSVIIKGMNMPEHCGCCRFSYDGICHALQRMRYAQGMKDGKLADCPLVEIPTPHGRLIDADEVEKAIKTAISICEVGSQELGLEDDAEAKAEIATYKRVLNGIKGEPTVIEGEG